MDKDGKRYQKMDEGLDKGLSPEVAARTIVRKLQKGKKEILVGGRELVMVHIRRFFPGLYYYLSTKVKPL